MRCENCGAELADGTRYCTNCGAEVAFNATQENVAENQQQTSYDQQAYNYAPQQQYYPQPVMDPPLSVGQYIGMFLLMAIPIVNLVLVLVWAFGGSVNRNKKNYARAVLIVMLISIVLAIILVAIFGITFFAFWDSGYNWGDSFSGF